MIAVAAPAAPAIPFALLALSSAIAFVVSWGLLHGWNRTLGAFLSWLADKSISLPSRLPDIHPFGFAQTINNNVVKYLGEAVAATEHAMVTSFQKMVGIIMWAGQEMAGLATDAYNAIRGVAHTTVTHVTKVITHTVVKPITRTVKATSAISKVQFNHLTHRVDVLAARVNHLAHAGAGAIAAPFPRIGHLEKTIKAQGARLTKLEKSIIGTVAAGFGVAILAKTLIGWLRCPSFARATRGRQCLDFDFLDALLTGALLIVGTISLVEFAEEVGTVTEEASGLIHGFLRDV